MLSNKYITYVGLALLVAYAYGIVTAQYKIFPYDIVREIKQFITSDTNAIAAKKMKMIHKKFLTMLKENHS